METYRYTSPPVLETKRTIMRQLFTSDANEIFLLRSDDKVNEFLNRQPATSIEDGFKFINKIKALADKGSTFYWAITLRGSSSLAGTITLWNFDKENSRAEVGYELLPRYQGKGIMHEVLGKVLDFAFGILKLKMIEGCLHPANGRSIKLMEKFGFSRDHDAEKRRDEDSKEIIYSLSRL